jgi:hypothetical protein
VDCFGLDVVCQVVEGDPIGRFVFEVGLQDVDLVEEVEVLNRQKLEDLLEVTVGAAAGEGIDVDD